jgi:hypothetical protein
LFTTNTTCPELGSNPGHRCEKPVTNRLSYSTVYQIIPYGDNPEGKDVNINDSKTSNMLLDGVSADLMTAIKNLVVLSI